MKQFGLFAALLMAVTVGCSNSSTPATSDVEVTKVANMTLCGVCGQVKDSDSCCAEGAEKCEKCGLVTGSPGCCNMTAGEDVTLCGTCGQVAGSDKCCAEGAETCKCGWQKGSPACCKIDKPAAEADSDEAAAEETDEKKEE